jgi:hypothetical protein
MWQPIETAPKDNKRPLWLARFNDDGTMQSFDYNGSWESESESWEMPQVYYYWASESGNVEEPSHWAYQPEGFCVLGAQPAPSVPEDMVDRAVTRFLSWKLPKDFHPDGGIVFIPTKGRGYDSLHWPYGTNLLNAQQARDMLHHVLAAAPEAKP